MKEKWQTEERMQARWREELPSMNALGMMPDSGVPSEKRNPTDSPAPTRSGPAPSVLKRILVVDDDLQFRRAMRAALSAHGYTVHDAQSGEEALDKLRAEIPDLVLLDMNLPGIGGPETCRAIRAISEVPIVILSVRAAETDKTEAFEAGANDYVTKPFSMQELLARITFAFGE